MKEAHSKQLERLVSNKTINMLFIVTREKAGNVDESVGRWINL